MLFAKSQSTHDPLRINNALIEQVQSVKLLGITVNDDLSWSDHVHNMVAKASQALYQVKILKRAGLTPFELVVFYKSIVRSLLEYCAPLWHGGLTAESISDIERIQKRFLKIVFPDFTYEAALLSSNLEVLSARRQFLCKKFFINIQHDENFKKFFTTQDTHHETRLNALQHFKLPLCRTNRFKNSCIPYCLFNLQ